MREGESITPQFARYLIFVVIGIGLFAASLWEIARSLRTGKLRLRVSTVSRERRPGLFWFDIAACGMTAILAALFAVHFLVVLLHQT